MTTYGTISPSSPPPPPAQPSTTQYISLAKQQIKSSLATRRPWKQTVESLSLPPHPAIAISRIKTNLYYFRSNYAITILTILFLALLYHPISLIVFVLTMSAWLFLYFLRSDPIVFMNRVIDDGTVLVVLSGATIGFLLLTDVTVNIVVGVVVGVMVVLLHGAVRRTDDLFLDEEEGDGAAGAHGGGGARVVLRDTASDAFSSSTSS
ncbi:hypothetical protein LguiB_018567 [Lonicera macranthoides]